ncbi:MAG: glycosyltransferase family 1 protein [Alphaproteobacteria bacterium]|nr:glycosyltransferase family 1 protein [Alphaproteobacteria bacterium]
MKILHIANFNLLKTNGCCENSMQRKITNGFIRAGHNVVTFSDRDLCRMLGITGSMNALGCKRVNDYLIKFALQICPDIIVLGHADTIKTETLLEIKKRLPNVKVIDWNVDNITSYPNAENKFNHDAQYTVQKLKNKQMASDLVLLTTADKNSLSQLKMSNNIVAFMPNIVDKSIETGRVFEHEKLPYDFLFAATPTLTREFCGQFVSVDTVAEDIKRHVPDLNPLFAGIAGNPKVHATQYQKACESAAMGLSLSHINSIYLYQSDRLAHFMGNGLLTFLDSASGYRDFFSNDEVAFYTTPEELYQKIAYYKANPLERMKVAKAGHDKYVALFNEVLVAEYIIDLVSTGQADKNKYPWAVVLS